MTTDRHWLKWGEQDPYFAVITNEKFRSERLDDAARAEFFASGQRHVRYVIEACRKYVDPKFAPKRALDFGCGVGRVVLPLAETVASVVGTDISPAMLAEARRNCDAKGVKNVELLVSDDGLSAVQGSFDLVHSFIVFQHIDMARGRLLFARLLELLAEGGIGALHVTTAKAYHPESYGQPPALPAGAAAPRAAQASPLRSFLGLGGRPAAKAEPRGSDKPADPEMQMNPYNLSELTFLLQGAGIKRFHAELTDHGGEQGAFLFFKKLPGASKPA